MGLGCRNRRNALTSEFGLAQLLDAARNVATTDFMTDAITMRVFGERAVLRSG